MERECSGVATGPIAGRRFAIDYSQQMQTEGRDPRFLGQLLEGLCHQDCRHKAVPTKSTITLNMFRLPRMTESQPRPEKIQTAPGQATPRFADTLHPVG
jgi:hypothetical protein